MGESNQIRRAVAIIHSRYDQPRRIASLANELGKRLFGHPPGRDIQRLRLTTPERASTGL